MVGSGGCWSAGRPGLNAVAALMVGGLWSACTPAQTGQQREGSDSVVPVADGSDTRSSDASTRADQASDGTAELVSALDTAPDVSEEVSGPGLCVGCEPGQLVCEGFEVHRCAELPTEPGEAPCTLWTLAERCDAFSVCDTDTQQCKVTPVIPDGFVTVDEGQGLRVESVLWSEGVGLMVYSRQTATARGLGLARFNAQGVLDAVPLDHGCQKGRLVRVQGQDFVHWNEVGGPFGGDSPAFIARVMPDLSLGTIVAATRQDIAQNIGAWSAGDGIFVVQETVSGQQATHMGWYGLGASEVTWLDGTPKTDGGQAQAVAGPTANGFQAAWFDATSGALVSALYSDGGAQVGQPVSTAITEGAAFASPVGLAHGKLWWVAVNGSGAAQLFASSLSAETLAAGKVVPVDAEYPFEGEVELVGVDDESVWITHFHDAGTPDTLMVAQVSEDGFVLQQRVVNSDGGGRMLVQDGEVVRCWESFNHDTIQCGLSALTEL